MKEFWWNIFRTAWGLVVSTKATWDVIGAAGVRARAVRREYVFPLAAVAVAVSFVFGFVYTEERMFEAAVLHAIIAAASLFGGYLVANFFCYLFLRKTRPDLADKNDCEIVAGYSFTTILLIEILTTVFPNLFFFKILNIFTAYLVWEGCRVIWMLKDEERGNIVLLFSVVIIFVPVVIRQLLRWMLPNI